MKIFRTGFNNRKINESKVHSSCRDFDHEKERCRREAERKCECAKQFLCNCNNFNGLLR